MSTGSWCMERQGDRWVGEFVLGSRTWFLAMECRRPGTGGEGFTLVITSSDGHSISEVDAQPGSTCSPLNIVFNLAGIIAGDPVIAMRPGGCCVESSSSSSQGSGQSSSSGQTGLRVLIAATNRDCSECPAITNVLLASTGVNTWFGSIAGCGGTFAVNVARDAVSVACTIGGPMGTSVGYIASVAMWDGNSPVVLGPSFPDLGTACTWPATITITP